HYELTENQRYAKLVTWLKRDELKQNKPNARASPTKQRLDFDSVLEKKNQMRDVTPVRAIHHEP
ncbi:MAG: hypothetical protein KGI50_07630, partial [Patescibacteria group bacterium]|nr:hypothetical protein [Patescibacteria group bacterium]